ncbi:nucleoid-associated protein [Planctomycetales bacterium]|nr:nucleoid-associated protein [Planctomycetales bacterium]GHT04439.1 nucleoid-associated protein [Planctomycetales bacterium]GHV23571.1 nucleoid-associated protein [Planctomycetales bacterium]
MDFSKMLEQAHTFGEMLDKKTKQHKVRMKKLRVEAAAGGGMVKVVMNGDNKIVKLDIEKEVIDPNDSELLADLIIAAVNDATAKVTDAQKENIEDLTDSIDLNALGLDLGALTGKK